MKSLRLFALGFAAALCLASQAEAANNFARLTPANKTTYHAFAAAYAGYATPTDISCLWGSTTKLIQVTGLVIMPGATAAAPIDFYIVKRSVADTGGTPTVLTAVSNDSQKVAPTIAAIGPVTYASAPVLGTSLGTYQLVSTLVVAKATTLPNIVRIGGLFDVPTSITFSTAPVLHGPTEGLCLNMNGVALPSGFTASIGWEWNEQ